MNEPPSSPPPEQPSPAFAGGQHSVDPRVQRSWQVWLSSLATDGDAATAAAHLYAELPGEARDAWLDALEEDVPKLKVPGAAVYGPLLAVESDPGRQARIRAASGTILGPANNISRALFGTGKAGQRMAVLVVPLYPDFVRVLACRFVKDGGFDWVRQDPIVHQRDAPVSGGSLDGIELFNSSTEAVVDELAHAVLAHRRQGRDLPQLLCAWSDLFSASIAD